MVLKNLVLLVAISIIEHVLPVPKTDLPQFEKYPATIEAVGHRSTLKIVDGDSRRYRTQLRRAYQQSPNFAGHYIMATWGCGASCMMGAIIDVKTGKVTKLPFTVSDWPLERTEPLDYKLNSSLLVVHGSRNEQGNGIYYYEIHDNNLKILTEVENKP